MDIKAVVFDLDGVIINSEPLHQKVFNSVCKNYGPVFTDEEYNFFVGKTDMAIWECAQKKYNLTEPAPYYIKLYTDAWILYLNSLIDEKPIDGIMELICYIESQNLKKAVASSSSKENVYGVLDLFKIKEKFDICVCGSDVKHGKPNPEIFLLAAERLDIAPNKCLVIEDSQAGVEAAKRAKMPCVGYINPSSGNQDLSKADHKVRSIHEVINILKK